MRKGFTLIELLAVIVILAIIALIAVPIILNIISDTKEKAIKLNAENYMDAVELAVANNHMKEGEKVLISGTYDIIQGGETIKLIKDENDKPIQENDQIELSVKYTGEGLKSGTVKLIDGKVRGLTGVKTDEGYDLLIILGEVKIIKDSNPVMLTTGQNFNAKIKTVVSGTETKPDVTDTTVKSIEFLGYGILPSGYTLEEFQKLERVDVSANEDETIYAIYDGNGKVYVYAENKIIFNETSSSMFKKFQSVEIIEFGEFINTSQVTNMYEMFGNCSSLIKLDVSGFDTSKVTSMWQMFFKCSSLTSIDVSNFDTSKVTDMRGMFAYCSRVTSLEVSNWDIGLVSTMQAMFSGCSSLTKLDTSDWNTSKVTSMHQMFRDCSNLTTLNVSNWDTIKVTTMCEMFRGCSNLTTLDVSNWNTEKVEDMFYLFSGCKSLIELDVGNWNTSNVTTMCCMFSGCNSLSGLNVNDWDTSKVTNMWQLFLNCSSLTELDLSNFDTSKITNMMGMFNGCTNLTKLDISSFDTSNVTEMKYMFYNTQKLKPIYIGEKWVIVETTDTYGMFSGSKTASIEELCEPGSTEEWCVVTG